MTDPSGTPRHWPLLLLRIGGASLCALGIGVVIGWHCHLEPLVRILPDLVPMQYNTALGFLLLGAGLIACGRERRLPAFVAGGAAALLGLLTALEHLAGIDLGIDKLLFEPYLDGGVYRPGRMAPISALSFALSGLALTLLPGGRATDRRALTVGLCAAGVWSLGTATLIGYVLGLPETYGWGNLTRMAVHTAAGFVVFGTALACWVLFGRAGGRMGIGELRRSILVYAVLGTAVIAFIGSTLATVPLYVRIQKNERDHLIELARSNATFCQSFLAHITDLAEQIGSRTRARQELLAVDRGEASPQAVGDSMTADLADAMKGTRLLAGIVRLGRDGRRLATVGAPIPDGRLAELAALPRTSVVGPLEVAGALRLIVAAPLRDGQGGRAGTDLVVAEVEELGLFLSERHALPASSEICVAVPSGEGVDLFAVRADGVLHRMPADARSFEEDTALRALNGEEGLSIHGASTSSPMLAAFAPVPGGGWGVVVRVDPAETFGNVNRQLASVAVSVLGLTLLGALGMFFLVRPLATNLIVHTGELQRQIELRTATLDAELAARKQIAEALRASEERYRLLSTASPIGIYQTDTAGRCIYTNARWQQITGLSLERSLGDGWSEAIHADDRAAIAAAWSATVDRGQDFAADFRFQTPEGEVRWVHSRATAMTGDDGKPLGYVGTVEDITQRRLAIEALAGSEAKFRSVVRSSSAGIVLANHRGEVLSWNQGAVAMFGYGEAEILGKPIALLMPERFRAAHGAGIARVVGGGEPRVVGRSVELVGLRKNGEEFPVELSLSMWKTDEGLFLSGILLDISARKRQEAELRAAKEAAEAAARAKSDFLATMSHEIRTPMNGVIGMTGLLMDTALTEQQRAMVDTVRTSADSLLTIINDILDFSKIEAGKMELEEIDFDLRQVIEDALSLLAEKAQAKQLELACAIASDVPVAVRGDPTRLRQVLVNLLSNALKFTDAGEVVVRATLKSDASSGLHRAIRGVLPSSGVVPDLGPVVVEFEVQDTGVGIPFEVQPRLFQSFTQADSSTTRRFGGTGLGLAICKRLVELMGGEISVISAPSAGSTFRFSVKLSPRIARPAIETRELAGARLLVVDDHPVCRQLFRQQTMDWGLDCETAAGGEEALAALRGAARGGRPFRLALIDMRMPGMDGLELGRRIKADPELTPLAMVLVTALNSTAFAGRARELGFAAVLSKPVRYAQMRATLARLASGGGDAEPRSSAVPAEGPLLSGRVLVAEDNAVNQRLTVAQLAKLGIHADVVANGAEALVALAQLPYDAVLMDCQMPEMDGFQATHELRRREAAAHQRRMPVLAMTANAMDGDRERCLAAGMDDYVSKPVRIEALAAALGRWLPGAAPPATKPAPVDGSALQRLRAEIGDDQTVNDIVRLFLTEAPGHCAAIAKAQAAGDAEQLRRASHKLRGSSQIMGAVRMAECCALLEALAKGNQLAETAELVAELRQALDDTIAALKPQIAAAT